MDDNAVALSLLLDQQRLVLALRQRCALLEQALGVEPGAPISRPDPPAP